MTKEEMDFLGSMNMFDEISNEAYQKIMTHCEEQESCDDCISRQAVEEITWEEPSYTDALNALTEVRDKIRQLPPVTPQPKMGEWLKNGELCKCSRCGSNVLLSAVKLYNYCYRCGCQMKGESDAKR